MTGLVGVDSDLSGNKNDERLTQVVLQFHETLSLGGVEGHGRYEDGDGWVDDYSRSIVAALLEAGWTAPGGRSPAPSVVDE